MINALTFVGWTLLNGSLMFFGVLNIRNPKTNEIETLVYPIVNDYNENCSFPGNDTNKDGPSPISIIEVTTKPSITTEPTNPEDDDKFETTAESITTAPNTTTALQTTAAPTNKYGECGFRNSKGRPRASTERGLSLFYFNFIFSPLSFLAFLFKCCFLLVFLKKRHLLGAGLSLLTPGLKY